MKDARRRQSESVKLKSDNAATMAWLEKSLAYARDGSPDGIKELLEAVRQEVLFEMNLAGNEPTGGRENGGA